MAKKEVAQEAKPDPTMRDLAVALAKANNHPDPEAHADRVMVILEDRGEESKGDPDAVA